MRFGNRCRVLILLVATLLFIYACALSLRRRENSVDSSAAIFAITPTHESLVQKADLIRLWSNLRNVPNLVWIVVEDSDAQSEWLEIHLKKSGMR